MEDEQHFGYYLKKASALLKHQTDANSVFKANEFLKLAEVELLVEDTPQNQYALRKYQQMLNEAFNRIHWNIPAQSREVQIVQTGLV